jgi:hypothetical protein
MSVVLVDVPVVTATLLTGDAPRQVRIVVTGLTAGQQVSVSAVTAYGAGLAVPGGTLVSDGSQLALIDNRSPLNTPVRYEVVVDGVAYSSNEVTVDYPVGQHLLQSLDGRTVVRFVWRDNALPRDPTFASVTFDVPGRRRPPARFVPGGDGGGELSIRTDRANGDKLRALLREGRPLVVRTDGAVRDFPAVELVLPERAPNDLWGGGGGVSTDRVWNISYVLVDDPEPGTPLSAATWDDFDAAWAGSTWDDFDAYYAGLTWDDFDTQDYGDLVA